MLQAQNPAKMGWQDYAIAIERNGQIKPRAQPAAPQITEWDKSILTSTNFLESSLDYKLCAKCDRPILTSSIAYHVQYACPKIQSNMDKRQVDAPSSELVSSPVEAPTSSNPVTIDSDNENTESETPSGKRRKKYKKRKGADLESPARVKKQRKDKTKSLPKAKAPVDIERQCGVPLANGMLCARSLTCKSHSMSAKRAVVGRSAPYDVLLANYQRKTQVKLASLSTAQQIADENEAYGGSPVNPEEEFAQVMEGVRRAVVFPIERKVLMPTRLKTHFLRMREMFASSLLPLSNSTLHGRANAFEAHNPEQLHFVRPPALQRAAYLKQQQLAAQARAEAAQKAQSQVQNVAATATKN